MKKFERARKTLTTLLLIIPIALILFGCGHISSQKQNDIGIFQKWDTVTLSFEGPQSSELADINPFTDYLLTVKFTHKHSEKSIRGFYAADGQAADSGASSGNIWQVRFTPDYEGQWAYEAEFISAKNIATSGTSNHARAINITNNTGVFQVIPSKYSAPDFRADGRLITKDGYFKFDRSEKYWLKGGTNSPENFLGYVEFDGTFLAKTSAREGEAVRDNNMHRFSPHIKDWQEGDPTWQNGKGKGIIGAINYLAAQGMNSVYFLTFNLGGDGNDVWPYASPNDFERFDVSKLEQWNIVFQHMQSHGILLHLVTQETENERTLDDGNTEHLRKLYYQELIARFGHHLALIWNLGEENGPADFSPHAQNDQQRKDMANYLATHDPYSHPVVIHSHSSAADKHHILGPLLGLPSLDGISFQVDDRTRVNQEVAEWRQLSREAEQSWLITMDEIGMWHTGALPDSVDSKHTTLRQHALWGAILGGAAGVEWYFGAKHPANDLSSEDWRLREKLWQQTRVALAFFNDRHYWQYKRCNSLLISDTDQLWNGYCAGNNDEYVIYLPTSSVAKFNASLLAGEFSINWFDPIRGGELRHGSNATLSGGSIVDLGDAPESALESVDQDWVILLKRK